MKITGCRQSFIDALLITIFGAVLIVFTMELINKGKMEIGGGSGTDMTTEIILSNPANFPSSGMGF